MKRQILAKSLFVSALLFSTLPPAIASILYFPFWQNRGAGVAISGLAAILLTVSFVPLFKLLKEKFKSPSAYVVWFVIFLIFFILSKVAAEMVVIAFTGFLGNLIGAILFSISKKISEIKESQKELS